MEIDRSGGASAQRPGMPMGIFLLEIMGFAIFRKVSPWGQQYADKRILIPTLVKLGSARHNAIF